MWAVLLVPCQDGGGYSATKVAISSVYPCFVFDVIEKVSNPATKIAATRGGKIGPYPGRFLTTNKRAYEMR